MNILIVDDSSDSRLLVKSHLTAAGYTGLVTAASARQAFRLLGMDGVTAVDCAIDLILMDITMPELDGIEACRRIKATRKFQDIPVIMVTGQHDDENLNLAFAAGATDYITKPLNKVELLARVRTALALRQEMGYRKQANAELEERNQELEQASLAKSQVLSTATHELKTPLTSIVGYVERMLIHQDTVGPLTERQHRYLKTVQKNARRLQALIDDLLDVSRIETGSLQLTLVKLDVGEEITEQVQVMQNQIDQKGIQLTLDFPPTLPLVKADRLRFSQVITNLVSNACKYSPPGAAVTMAAKALDGLVQIDVSDTGIGISKANQTHLFTKFFRVDNSSTRQTSGTGLGLFITKHIVEAHGGTIWVETEEGKGSTFSFTMPQIESGAASLATAA